jgi:hypothetical protein
MNVVIWDIETLKEMFLVGIYDPHEKIYHEFEVSKSKYELEKFAEFCEKYKEHYWVGYNNLRFDSQVVEWVLRNYENWAEKTNLEIAAMIAQKAQDVIDDGNYELPPMYQEDELSLKQIDLFTIWHFNNKNRRTSLKALQFYMNLENIEEMPIHHTKANLTLEERRLTKEYCRNDVMSTYEFYKITRGETNIKIYKGEDKIADRLAMEKEFGLKCLNWDDVKIGAEWNKLDYMALTGKPYKEIRPSEIKHFYGKKFKQFFPKWVNFQTKELKKFVDEFGEKYALATKQEFKYKFNDELIATIAKGGIHSNESGRFLQPEEDEQYWQIDIGSQYPNAIRKYKVEPLHLPGWNKLIVSKIDRRLNYKKLYQESGDPKFNSLQKMGKLALNGGSYGRLNTKGDWQEYPYGMLQVTVGGQLEILMVVEDLLLKGHRVVSLNTDGFDCIIKKSRFKEFESTLSYWEKVIGNDFLGNFEYTEFEWIAQTSVNDYLALKKDGKVKAKGDFEIYKEANKNPSCIVVPIALERYFVDGVDVRETIVAHSNPYDFCIRQKSTKDFHYEGYRKGKDPVVYNKLIRYYVSNEGEKLMKIKNKDSDSTAPEIAQVEAGEWLCKVVNYLPKTTNVKDMDINYEYYIEKAESMIVKILSNGKKKKQTKKIPNQLSMF